MNYASECRWSRVCFIACKALDVDGYLEDCRRHFRAVLALVTYSIYVVYAGVYNLAALGNVVMWQRMDYDFEYHTQSFFTDLVVLVMSEGKSLLKVHQR